MTPDLASQTCCKNTCPGGGDVDVGYVHTYTHSAHTLYTLHSTHTHTLTHTSASSVVLLCPLAGLRMMSGWMPCWISWRSAHPAYTSSSTMKQRSRRTPRRHLQQQLALVVHVSSAAAAAADEALLLLAAAGGLRCGQQQQE